MHATRTATTRRLTLRLCDAVTWRHSLMTSSPTFGAYTCLQNISANTSICFFAHATKPIDQSPTTPLPFSPDKAVLTGRSLILFECSHIPISRIPDDSERYHRQFRYIQRDVPLCPNRSDTSLYQILPCAKEAVPCELRLFQPDQEANKVACPSFTDIGIRKIGCEGLDER